MTLVGFLLARIDDDETTFDAMGRDFAVGPRFASRLLADCEAKRQIIQVLDKSPCPCATSSRCVIHDRSAGPPEFARDGYLDPVTDATLRALALPYADHPEYDGRWQRP